MKRKKKTRRRQYMPRVTPAISTSSKTFVDGKTKARSRRALEKAVRDYDGLEEPDRGG